MHIALLEPYYGGSHAAFCDGLVQGSRHDITLVTLPARKWKWRMRGAATWFAIEENAWINEKPDLILCNDMLSVADLRALLPAPMRTVPIVCYFHENQLTYPIPDDQTRDYQYAMTNITSALAADAVWFNSQFHRADFLSATDALLAKMPDFVPHDVGSAIREKSSILYPPVSVATGPRPGEQYDSRAPVTILWPHRWEHDKNPEPFFAALIHLAREGYDFRLVLLGEQFRTAPVVFEESWDALGKRIHHAGYIESRQEYEEMLASCDVVVSTAIQENFGIAVVEAMLAGCQPLLPSRLAYPELIPKSLHAKCLYKTDKSLLSALREILTGTTKLSPTDRDCLSSHVTTRYGAEVGLRLLDDAAEGLVEQPVSRAAS